MEKLSSYLIRCGFAGASELRTIIEAGDVTVDGQLARSGDVSVTPLSRVLVRGVPITLRDPYTRIFCYHKPKGTVCAGSDEHNRLPISHAMVGANEGGIEVLNTGRSLHLVNVLPINADGLVVLTNDPGLAHNLIASRPGVVIRTHTIGWISEQRLRALRRGVRINGKQYAPVDVERVTEHANSSTVLDWIVKPTERNRSFVTLLRSLGVKILRMSCTRVGPLVLRGLRPGYVAEVPVPRQWAGLLDERWWPWDPERSEVATQLRAYWAAARAERESDDAARTARFDLARAPAVRRRRDASLAASLDEIDSGALASKSRVVALTRDGVEVVQRDRVASPVTLSGLPRDREALLASGQADVMQRDLLSVPRRAFATGPTRDRGSSPPRNLNAASALQDVGDDLASLYGASPTAADGLGAADPVSGSMSSQRDSYFGRRVPMSTSAGALERGSLDIATGGPPSRSREPLATLQHADDALGSDPLVGWNDGSTADATGPGPSSGYPLGADISTAAERRTDAYASGGAGGASRADNHPYMRGGLDNTGYFEFDPSMPIRSVTPVGTAGDRGAGWADRTLEDSIVDDAAAAASYRGERGAAAGSAPLGVWAEDEGVVLRKGRARRGPPVGITREAARQQSTFGLGAPRPAAAKQRQRLQ